MAKKRKKDGDLFLPIERFEEMARFARSTRKKFPLFHFVCLRWWRTDWFLIAERSA